ncbi:hypothetical protein [Dyella sp. 20L07]|uniref:hypothetical protein n=1 Tax=Dyella sp. 20L07 TaxID=3384240 RepID=UPI003D272418
MTVRVGKYLVQGKSVATNGNDRVFWMGAWTIFRSPSGNGQDWESLVDGKVSQVFSTTKAAVDAGEAQGAERARELQSDDWLEPMKWPEALSDRTDG